ADGAPILEHRTRYLTWARVLGREYEKLQNKQRRDRRAVMNKYGATNPAEFFAVATETFFEKSRQLKTIDSTNNAIINFNISILLSGNPLLLGTNL
ncbi:zinc-dependent peptidase, partial [Planctomycetota bacterium]